MKKAVFSLFQPLSLVVICLFWAFAPSTWVHDPITLVIATTLITAIIQLLEFVNERHTGWRLNRLEFLTDLFYTVLASAVLSKVEDRIAEQPLVHAKHALGITTDWALHSPFIVQVALVIFLIEFGQYWMHRAMHNTFLWWTHAPHHHITQLNAMKGAVGNPIELILVSLSVVSLFDLNEVAVFCAASVLTAVSTYAHANVRFDPPRWYSYLFTTIESHSLHHSVTYADTRCNYANSLILIDHMFGTFREGESAVVGQDERVRLSIWQQFKFPFLPLIAAIKSRQVGSAPAAG